MKHNPCKIRISWPSAWLRTKMITWSQQVYLSEEFLRQMEQCGISGYRHQSHAGFVTVVFQRPQDAAWVRLMMDS